MAKWLYPLLVGLILLLGVSGVEAHKPLWADGNSVAIPDLSTSFAAYRQLATAEEVDTFVINTAEGKTLRGRITIPQIDGLEGYGVRAALFGPGLPDADHEQLPPDHPEGVGALVFPSRVTATFFEPFTQTSYWGRQAFEVPLPAAGTYYLLIWNPEGERGKYVLATGSEERFAPADIFRFPIWWVRVHLFFGHTGYLLLGAALLLGLGAGLLLWHRQRPLSSRPDEEQVSG